MAVRAGVDAWAAMATVAIGGSSDVRFEERRAMTLAPASIWISEKRPKRLYFLWSTPTGAVSSVQNLTEIAGFEFRRAGAPVEVHIVRSGSAPNEALLRAGGADPDAGLLWFSDNPLSKENLPRIGSMDRSWQCRDFSRRLENAAQLISVYACRRPGN